MDRRDRQEVHIVSHTVYCLTPLLLGGTARLYSSDGMGTSSSMVIDVSVCRDSTSENLRCLDVHILTLKMKFQVTIRAKISIKKKKFGRDLTSTQRPRLTVISWPSSA